jgi:3-phenylpropionate/trans-cinnamate dioxygenase ferredoxin subunit
VCSVAEFRLGSLRQVTVEGRFLCVACTEVGEVYAIDDICSHEQEFLSRGTLIGTQVQCVAHGSRFDVRTGDVMESPAERSIESFAVVIDGDDVLVEV